MTDRSPIHLIEAHRRRRKLRDNIADVKAWLQRYATPGWLVILVIQLVWVVAWVNKANALLRCGR